MVMKPSPTFRSTRTIQKLVDEDHIIGYVVYGSSKHGGAAVSPLFESQVSVKVKGTTHIFLAREQGERLNGEYFDDPEGHVLASVASIAIARLVERAEQTKRKATEAKKKTRRKR